MTISDRSMLIPVIEAVEAAATELRLRFNTAPAPLSRDDVITRIREADSTSTAILRPLLERASSAGWVEDELDDGPLPNGEWWVTDPVEGAINYVHGLRDWGVTATLVRDNQPVVTAVAVPFEQSTYAAVSRQGAWLDGRVIRVSSKEDLSAALVGTGQASPRETADTFRLVSRTLPAMMSAAAVTRVSVPPTLQLVQIAAGRMDVFWQHSAVRSGLLAGALIVKEAGGLVTDLSGRRWSLASSDFLASTPGVHSAAVRTLTSAL